MFAIRRNFIQSVNCILFGTFLLVFLTLDSCTSKKGCIDPGSISYDPNAKIDNGSCTYPQFSLTLQKITKLNSVFDEISASKYENSRIFSIIDPPGEHSIYSFNTLTGEPKEEVKIPGISAVNFEALTLSDTHFFIGDIGNNLGNRTNFVIYKIPKPQTFTTQVDVNNFETISFNFPEQVDFRSNTNTNYDVESLIYSNNKLYVFTKNHEDNKTYLYEMPAEAGNYAAKLIGKFDVKGMITDADINKAGNKIVLIGHNETSSRAFLWVISNVSGSEFFLGNKFLVDIGSIYDVGHVEGVSFIDDDNVFITNEKFASVNANLYYLDISGVK